MVVGTGIEAKLTIRRQEMKLLKVAVAEVPSVDTLNTMLDKNLKNTPFHYKNHLS